jgi:nucleolar protein 9
LKTLIDSCIEQEVDATGVVKAIAAAYSCDSSSLIFEMLHITLDDLKVMPVEEDGGQQKVISKPKRDPNQLHGSLLAQTILSLPPDFCAPIVDSILSQSPDTIIALSKHPQASHVVQKLLNSPHATIPTKRKFLNHLKGRFTEIALDTVGSHIVDECWNSPMNYRQSIAEELLRAEPEMRDSYSGRAVWRNWSMDKFKTRRQQWFNIEKGDGEGQKIGGGGGNKGKKRTKTAIELARERHAAAKADGFGTGANSTSKRTARDIRRGDSKKQRVR